MIEVYPDSAPQAVATTDLVNHFRNDVLPAFARRTGVGVLVGGFTAGSIDFSHVLGGKLPLFFAIVILLSALLLFVIFRSVSYTHLDVYKRQAHHNRKSPSVSSSTAPRFAPSKLSTSRSPGWSIPGTKLSRSRPRESWSSCASALASRNGLRPNGCLLYTSRCV